MTSSTIVAPAARVWSAARTRWLRRRLAKDPVGFNFFGSVSGNLGLGEAARHSLTALRSQGYPVAITDVDPGAERGGQILTHGRPGERSANKGRYPINLFHINPPEALGFLWGRRDVAARDRINVCVPFWELEDLPDDWVEFLEAMDVVLAPTDFIAEAVRKALPDMPCVPLPQAVPLRTAPTRDRDRWGLPDNAVVFLATFDLLSDPSRKNPAGAVTAFRTAFPNREDVRLVLKTQPVPVEETPKRERLHALAEGDARIVFIEAALPIDELSALHRAADVYVSLHRSEGLGLGLMEALSLGVPVIATAYSGPMDFLTQENSLLIPYSLVPLAAEIPVYQQMAGMCSWADPDLERAAAAMQQMADDPELRMRLGDQGRKDMGARRQEAARGLAISRLIGLMRNEDRLWSNHPARHRAFKTLAPARIPSLGVMRHRAAVRAKRVLRLEV